MDEKFRETQEFVNKLESVVQQDIVIEAMEMKLLDWEREQIATELRKDKRFHRLAQDVLSLLKEIRSQLNTQPVKDEIWKEIDESITEMKSIIDDKIAHERHDLSPAHKTVRGDITIVMNDANTLLEKMLEIQKDLKELEQERYGDS